MASSTVGTAVIKLSFDGSDVKAELSKTSSDFKQAGTEAGATFGNALTVAMGSLISKGVSKVISAVSSNLDSAINRVDVINNFPKVMQSLGFSTDEAASSIKTISDRLDGLPSTLNGVVSDVQKLTATMGNLNTGMVNATSLGLALNDMFLAGGKGTEAASNAMEQYNQMLAQGKPDMQSWRSILNAAPGQLKQLAQTLLGAKANQQDLYEALQKGNVTFAQMNEAIVRLDKEGGKGFASYEKQARSATGGVGTALENVQNRISKAIAKVIETIGSENIANAINGISSHFIEIGESVGKFIKDAMSRIGELAKFISQNMWIVDTIKAALAGIAAMQIGMKIIDLKNKLTGLFTTITTFVAAHPILAIVSALSALAVGIVSAMTREDELQKAVKATREQYENARESLDQLNATRQQTLDRGLSELSYYAQLKEELGKITDENGVVQKGYERRAQFIVNTLSEALGIEIKLTDGVIQGYKNIADSIDKVIAKKKAELLLKSQEEAYTESIQKRAEVPKRLVEISKQIEEAQYEPLTKRRKLLEELTKSKKEEEALYREYSANIQRYESDLASYTEGAYDKMSTAAWNNSLQLANAENASVKTIQEAINQIDVELDLATRAFEDTGLEIYKTTSDSLTKTRGELVEKLRGMNISVADSMYGAKSTVVKTLNSAYDESKKAAAGFSTIGTQVGVSISSGLLSKSGAVNSSVNGVLNNAKNATWGSAWNNGWNLGDRVGSAAASGISASSQKALNQAYALMDRLRNIVGQSIPGPTVQGFRQQYNFATHSYDYVPMATGGYVQGATTALIGEAGKEVVLPLQQNTNNWSGLLANAIMEQMDTMEAGRPITVYMNNTIDNDMSIDELGRKFSQSIRRYA